MSNLKEQLKEIKRVGVIGGGQLAWMMAGAAEKLGVELVIQTPQPTDPAAAIASDTILAPIDDAEATAKLANRCDVITFENEFINLAALKPLEGQGVCFRPKLAVLAPLLDKYEQRCYLRDIGLPVPKFTALEGEGGRENQFQQLAAFSPSPFPVVLKARRNGYDGQGTFIVKNQAEWESILGKLANNPLMLEEFIPFERELAVIVARSVAGEIVVYPVVETQQENQVCRRVLVPANLNPLVTMQIEAIAQTLLNSLQAVGIFGIELFLTKNGKVLVNEISPRTHNSGHYTLDACETSQFEQHLRAVCGLPLGKIACTPGAVMVNLLGYEYSQNDYLAKRQQLAAIPNAHIHWYGKTESRPGRKLGHVTVVLHSSLAGEMAELQAIADKIESIWYSDGS